MLCCLGKNLNQENPEVETMRELYKTPKLGKQSKISKTNDSSPKTEIPLDLSVDSPDSERTYKEFRTSQGPSQVAVERKIIKKWRKS
jgi:hypothetical protein